MGFEQRMPTTSPAHFYDRPDPSNPRRCVSGDAPGGCAVDGAEAQTPMT